MKKPNGYENAQAYTEYEQLPVGGYVLKIVAAEGRKHKSGNGSSLVLAFDVAEGDYEGYYKADFDRQKQEDKKWHGVMWVNLPKDDGSDQDEWTLRKLKTIIQNIEDSNSCFHWDWDEKKLKGKLIGGLFGLEEYEKNNGDIGLSVKCRQFTTVDKIHKGSFKVPDAKTIGGGKKPNASGNYGANPADDDDELPF
jgi:hypothetical protein